MGRATWLLARGRRRPEVGRSLLPVRRVAHGEIGPLSGVCRPLLHAAARTALHALLQGSDVAIQRGNLFVQLLDFLATSRRLLQFGNPRAGSNRSSPSHYSESHFPARILTTRFAGGTETPRNRALSFSLCRLGCVNLAQIFRRILVLPLPHLASKSGSDSRNIAPGSTQSPHPLLLPGFFSVSLCLRG